MNIRELADQAGLKEAVLLRVYGTENALCDSEIAVLRQIEKFAELVAAHEREECAKLCFSIWNKWLDTPEKDHYKVLYDAEDCAKAIRARGEA